MKSYLKKVNKDKKDKDIKLNEVIQKIIRKIN